MSDQTDNIIYLMSLNAEQLRSPSKTFDMLSEVMRQQTEVNKRLLEIIKAMEDQGSRDDDDS